MQALLKVTWKSIKSPDLDAQISLLWLLEIPFTNE